MRMHDEQIIFVLCNLLMSASHLAVLLSQKRKQPMQIDY